MRGARFALPLLLLPAMAALAACSGDPLPPGAVTAEEEQQLNEAAAMLEANSIRLDEVAPTDGNVQ